MFVPKLVLTSLVAGLVFGQSCTAEDVRVLFFTMDSCPPCKQMEPGIDRLQAEGVPVSKIDVRQYQQYANQCRVSQTPTVLFVQGQQVLARHSGALSYQQLRNILNTATPPGSAVSTQAQPVQNGNASRPIATPAPARSLETNNGQLTAEQLAHRATVRFRVEDSEGVSFATGTIVHRHDNEALVVTCGHVFRDSGGKGIIHADLGFAFGESTTVRGKLIFYDAREHDIALVAIPCALDIQPIRIAPEMLTVETGDQVFSLGCDRGADPTIRRSVLKAVTRYSGVSKYDIVGRPVDGRSGGGLFSAGGQLIGVCNAAAVEVDEGIYTGLQSIYWQLAKTNLTHLFQRRPTPSALSFDTETAIARNASASDHRPSRTRPATGSRQNAGQLDHPRHRNVPAGEVVARNNELSPPVSTAVFRGNEVPVTTAEFSGGEVPLRSASQRGPQSPVGSGADNQPSEMIVLVRSESNPNESETITIRNPDQETIRWLRELAQEGGNASRRAIPAQMANLPRLQPPRQENGEMRAQSPR